NAATTQRSALAVKHDYYATSFQTKLLPLLGTTYIPLAFILDSQAKSTYQSRAGGYNASLGIIGGVYAVQLLHVLILGPGAQKTQASAPVRWFAIPSVQINSQSGKSERVFFGGISMPIDSS